MEETQQSESVVSTHSWSPWRQDIGRCQDACQAGFAEGWNNFRDFINGRYPEGRTKYRKARRFKNVWEHGRYMNDVYAGWEAAEKFDCELNGPGRPQPGILYD